MVNITQKVQVVLEYLTKGVATANAAAKKVNDNVVKEKRRFDDANKSGKRRIENTQRNTIAQSGFGQVMGMGITKFKQFNQSGYKFNSVGGRMANRLRIMTHGMRGFRMEMLGTMFFGMSLIRIFGGLMKTSMDWMGVTEVLSATLGVLFMPVAEKLLNWVMSFMDWVDKLSPGQKDMINNFVLWGAILGIILAVIGTLALGIGSLILVFGKLFGIDAPIKALVGVIKGAFLGLSAPILVVIAIIVAIVIGMYLAWKENFMGMKKIVADFIQGVKDLFSGLIEIFKGFFLVIKGIFLGDWSIIWEGVKKIFSGAVQSILAILQVIVTGLAAIGIGIIKVVWNIIQLILAPFIWLYDTLIGHSLIPDLVNGIIDWFKKIPGKVLGFFIGLGKKIANAFGDMIPNWMMKIFKGGISIGNKFGSIFGSIFGFANGGVVPGPVGKPTIAVVHGGESITPPGKTSGVSPNITIHASINPDYDVHRLADELKRYWVSDFERSSVGRGT